MLTLEIFTDGGSRGNPGPSASAFVVFDHKGEQVHKKSKYLGIGTNNYAEYYALLMAHRWLQKQPSNPSRVEFFLDSELVVKQLLGQYRIKSKPLASIYHRVLAIKATLSYPVSYHHVKRDKNKIADRLLNETLDNYLKKA